MGNSKRSRKPSLLRVSDGERGFTLIEILVAMFLVVAIMTALLGLVVSSLGTLAQARQRQAGAALATEAIEAMRALPYDTTTLASGASCNTGLGWSSTSNYVVSGSPERLNTAASGALPAVPGIPIEELVRNTVSPCVSSPPASLDNTVITVRQYVTRGATTGTFNLTAIATWPEYGGGIGVAAERSTTYSPGGCLSTGTHPFSGPCQAAYSARAGSDAASVTVTKINADPSVPPVLSGVLTLPSTYSDVSVEQVVTVGSGSVGSAASGSTGPAAPLSITGSVSSDPTRSSGNTYSTPTPLGWTATTAPSSPFSISAPSPTASFAGKIAADTATCGMPTSTGGTQAVSTGPTGELRPCGRSTSEQSSAASITHSLANILTVSGVSVSAGAGHIFQGPSGGVCGAAAPGCARSSAYRTIDAAVMAPEVTSGSSTGMWNLNGLTEYALAERGATASTTAPSRSGTLRLWNGTTHVAVSLTKDTDEEWTWGNMADPVDPADFPEVVVNGLRISGTLSITPATPVPAPATVCADTACVETRQTGTISGSFAITAPDGTTHEVEVNLGGISAVASYQAAPVA